MNGNLPPLFNMFGRGGMPQMPPNAQAQPNKGQQGGQPQRNGVPPQVTPPFMNGQAQAAMFAQQQQQQIQGNAPNNAMFPNGANNMSRMGVINANGAQNFPQGASNPLFLANAALLAAKNNPSNNKMGPTNAQQGMNPMFFPPNGMAPLTNNTTSSNNNNQQTNAQQQAAAFARMAMANVGTGPPSSREQKSVPRQKKKKKILQPHDHDVLCGRGGLTNFHRGNVWYRRLVKCNRPLYRESAKYTKLLVSKAIVQAVHSQNPPGRFIEQLKNQGSEWYEISYKRALDKTSQALREKDMEKEDNDGDLDNLNLTLVRIPLPDDASQNTQVAVKTPPPVSITASNTKNGSAQQASLGNLTPFQLTQVNALMRSAGVPPHQATAMVRAAAASATGAALGPTVPQPQSAYLSNVPMLQNNPACGAPRVLGPTGQPVDVAIPKMPPSGMPRVLAPSGVPAPTPAPGTTGKLATGPAPPAASTSKTQGVAPNVARNGSAVPKPSNVGQKGGMPQPNVGMVQQRAGMMMPNGGVRGPMTGMATTQRAGPQMPPGVAKPRPTGANTMGSPAQPTAPAKKMQKSPTAALEGLAHIATIHAKAPTPSPGPLGVSQQKAQRQSLQGATAGQQQSGTMQQQSRPPVGPVMMQRQGRPPTGQQPGMMQQQARPPVGGMMQQQPPPNMVQQMGMLVMQQRQKQQQQQGAAPTAQGMLSQQQQQPPTAQQIAMMQKVQQSLPPSVQQMGMMQRQQLGSSAQQMGGMPQMQQQQQQNMQQEQQSGTKRQVFNIRMPPLTDSAQPQLKKQRVENGATSVPGAQGATTAADASANSQGGTNASKPSPAGMPNFDEMSAEETQKWALQLMELAKQKQAKADAAKAHQDTDGAKQPNTDSGVQLPSFTRTEHSFGSVGSNKSDGSQTGEWMQHFHPVQQQDGEKKKPATTGTDGNSTPPPTLEKSVSEALLSLATGPSKFLPGAGNMFDRNSSGSSSGSASAQQRQPPPPAELKTAPTMVSVETQASQKSATSSAPQPSNVPQKGSMILKGTSTTLPRRGTNQIPQKQLLRLQPRPNSKRGQKPILPLRPRPGTAATKHLLPLKPRPSGKTGIPAALMPTTTLPPPPTRAAPPRRKSIQEEMADICTKRNSAAAAAAAFASGTVMPGAPPMLQLQRSASVRGGKVPSRLKESALQKRVREAAEQAEREMKMGVKRKR